MRKSIILLLSGILISGMSGVAFAGYTYTEPTYNEAKKVNNTAQNQKEAYKEIQLVRFANRSSISPGVVSGDAVIWDIISADGMTVRISTATQSADGSFAGIMCSTILTNDGAGNTIGSSNVAGDDAGRINWGYMVIHGPCFASTSAGGTNSNTWGDPVIISNDSGKITTFEAASTDAVGIRRVNKVAANVAGFFMQSADGSSTTYKVFLKNV